MVKHIVMWKIKDENKQENLEKAKVILEGLNGKIPGLISLEVGIDFVGSDASAELCLYSVLESKEALSVYAVHPEHLKAVEFMKTIVTERKSADYEI